MMRLPHMHEMKLGIIETMNARPIQAALASAGTFAIGAALPLLVAFVVSEPNTVFYVAGMSLAFLALLGGLAAKAGVQTYGEEQPAWPFGVR